MVRSRSKPFVVALPLPEEERAVIEIARQRLGLRSWGEVALHGWRKVKAELGLSQNGGGNGKSA